MQLQVFLKNIIKTHKEIARSYNSKTFSGIFYSNICSLQKLNKENRYILGDPKVLVPLRKIVRSLL
jgi:hypothetical protein